MMSVLYGRVGAPPGTGRLSAATGSFDDTLGERCESGRIGLTANELTWETGSEGSNPSLSALPLRLRRLETLGTKVAACAGRLSWWPSDTGWRPWGVRRTRSTRTSWPGRCGATATSPPPRPDDADLVVVNTCAFIEAARQESIDTILELAAGRHDGRAPGGHGMPGRAPRRPARRGAARGRPGGGVRGARHAGPADRRAPSPTMPRRARPSPSFDLLNLPRPAADAPWAYVKVAEGCDRRCGFCAIPSFRGLQRSRPEDVVLAEVDELGDGVHEVVLVAQDLASWGLDRSAPERVAARRRGTPRPIVGLVRRLSQPGRAGPAALSLPLGARRLAHRRRDLHRRPVLRPVAAARVADRSCSACGGGVTASGSCERIDAIRAAAPDAALRSSFILGYPGETEDDHDLLLSFLAEARLDWAGLLHLLRGARHLRRGPPRRGARRARPGAAARVLGAPGRHHRRAPGRRWWASGSRSSWTSPASARSHREAPDIDGVVHVDRALGVGEFHKVMVTGAAGPDLWADVVSEPLRERMHVSTFGPSALNTPANAITVARLLATPRAGGDDRGARPGVGAVRGGPRHRPHRRGRRMAGAPPGHDPLGRLPRPPGRQGRRGGRAVRGGGQGRGVVAPRRRHRGARGVDERVPHRRGPARHLDPGPGQRQGEDARPGHRHPAVPGAVGGAPPRRPRRRRCGWRSPSRW